MPDTEPIPLVLVVGAGASSEARLPVGAELKVQIARSLNIQYPDGFRMTTGDAKINEAFRILAAQVNPRHPDINPYLRAAWRIHDAMPQAMSIDNFIDSHKEDVLVAQCGKLAITRCILRAEAQSLLYVNPSNIYNKVDFASVGTTWFSSVFQLLTESCQRNALAQRLSRVSIVCFNYDRCIEHYLHSSLQNYYGLSPQEAAEALSNLTIYHPYGTVGSLPWQNQRPALGFGADPSAQTLVCLSNELRTFSEGTDSQTSDIDQIRVTVASADRLVFLGFAYHRLNMDLLLKVLEDGEQARQTKVFGTAHGISTADVEDICAELVNRGGISVDRTHLRNDLTCAGLIREYWRLLSIQ